MTIKYLDSKRIVKLSTDIDSISNVVTTTQALTNEYTQASSSANPSGQVFKSGAALIGETITEFTFGLRTVGGSGTRTGTITMGIFSETDDSLIKSFREILWSDLTTTDTDYTATGTHVLAADQVVGIQWVGTGNGEVAFYSQNTQVYDGTNSYVQEKGNGNTGRDAKFQIKTGTPVYKPTNVQNNSILVEKDTAKRFWFSEALAPTYGGNDITTDITWTQTIGSSTSDTFYILKDTGNDLMDIKAAGNCGTFANPSIGYATLGSTLSSSSWIVRFKLVFNTVTAESTGGKSFLTTFGVVDTATDWQDSENGFIFRFIADSGSAQTQFGSVTSGTVSTTSMSWTPATNNTIYVQIAYSSGTATANFYSDPEFLTGVGTANVTRSGTFSGIRYPQIAFLQDTGGNGVMEIDMKDLKIYNEATSIADAAWTRQAPLFTASFWAAGGTQSPWTPVNYHDEYSGGTWSTATALGTAVQMVSGCGTKTAGLVIGGDTSGTANPISTVQAWNGSAWSTSTGGTMNVARNQHAAGGSSISAWAVAGRTGGSANNTTSFWDNSSWTSGATTSTDRRNHGGAGSTDDCWITGGYEDSTTTVLASTEQYNGTAWSAGGNLGTATNSIMGGGGDSYNAIITGGNEGTNSNKSNIYNGTAWSLGGTLSTAHKYGHTSGTPQDAGAYLGYISSWTPTWSETYNGTAWTTQGNVSNGRASGAGGN